MDFPDRFFLPDLLLLKKFNILELCVIIILN